MTEPLATWRCCDGTSDSSEESDEDMAPTDIAASGTAAEAEEKLENVHGDTTA
ncbi:hypothetical protein F443_11123, partial [Phytophthora nicotianae P1569]